MRKLSELLQLMLENIDLIHTGLCLLNYTMKEKGIITRDEERIIFDYFCQKFPIYKAKHKSPLFPDGIPMYQFPSGEKEPRIEWLKEQISKLQEQGL